jgi:cytochrome c oxidase subunit I+III
MITGAPEQLIVLPRPSFLPLWTGLATGLVFLSLLFKLYWVTPPALLLVVGLFLVWPRTLGSRADRGPLDIGAGETAPEDSEVKGNVTYWGNLLAAAANATLYASLLFGGLYLVVVAPGWERATTLAMTPFYGLLPMLSAIAAAGLAHRALALNTGGRNPAAWLAAAAATALVASLSLLPIVVALPDITAHANAAVSFAVLCYCMIHAGLALLISAHAWWRHRRGYVSMRRATDLRLAVIWQDYAAVAMLAGIGLVFFLATQGSGP